MNVEVDVNPALRTMAVASRQFPFALARTLNALAIGFQTEERNVVDGRFILRRAPFVLNTIKIPRGSFATKRKLYVDVVIDPQRNFLAKFEQGGQKRAQSGGLLSVPVEARPSPRRVVARAMRREALNIRPVRTKSGKVQWKGDNRTFEIETGNFSSIIFQRRSSAYAKSTGRDPNLKVLYVRTRAVPIEPDLRFRITAGQTARRFPLQATFNQEFAAAMRTAR